MKFQYAHPPGFPAPAQEFISDTEREEFDDNDEQPSFPLVLFVYNLPTVEQAPEKEEKLLNAITRKFSKHFGTTLEKPGFEVEIRFKSGMSHPCAIVRFKGEKPASAESSPTPDALHRTQLTPRWLDGAPRRAHTPTARRVQPPSRGGCGNAPRESAIRTPPNPRATTHENNSV